MSAAPERAAPERAAAVVIRAESERLTIEVTVHKSIHPALFAALSEVDRRHRAERVRLLGTRGLLAEQQPDVAAAASRSQSSLSSVGSVAGLSAREPNREDGALRAPSAVVDSDVESVFR